MGHSGGNIELQAAAVDGNIQLWKQSCAAQLWEHMGHICRILEPWSTVVGAQCQVTQLWEQKALGAQLQKYRVARHTCCANIELWEHMGHSVGTQSYGAQCGNIEVQHGGIGTESCSIAVGTQSYGAQLWKQSTVEAQLWKYRAALEVNNDLA